MDRAIVEQAYKEISDEHVENTRNYYRSEGAMNILQALLKYEGGLDAEMSNVELHDEEELGCPCCNNNCDGHYDTCTFHYCALEHGDFGCACGGEDYCRCGEDE